MIERRDARRIAESLTKEGFASRAQVKEALNIQKQEGGFLGCILVKREELTEEKLAIHAVERYGYPFLTLSNYQASSEAIEVFPEELARKYLTVPLDKIGDLLTVAHAHPLESEMFKEIEKVTGCALTSYISTISEVEKALEVCYSAAKKDDTSKDST